MVRTKADAGSTKVSAAKAPRKGLGTPASRSGGASPCSSLKDRYAGGNAYNPQPTPDWQKGITSFFQTDATSAANTPKEASSASESLEAPCSSSSSSSVSASRSISPIDDGGEGCSSASSRIITPIDDAGEGCSSQKEVFAGNGMISDDED